MRQRTYTYYNDPGHGWLSVPYEDWKSVGVEVSRYSKFRALKGGIRLYLEEDLDGPTFIKALEAEGVKVNLRDYHSNQQSRIRNYDSVVELGLANSDD